MADKEKLILSDKETVPTDKFIYSILGEKKIFWQDIMNYMSDNYNDSSGTWNYYNDGKQWLFKMVLKKKTVFWSGILEDAFRITFYFGDKAEPLIMESKLPAEIKEGFKSGPRYGKIRAISIKVNDSEDVEIIKKIIPIKIKLK